MFLAYNKPLQKNIVDAKADLMAETLHTLKTDKITGFFSYVRESQDTLPTDGQLKKLLSSNYDKFSNMEAKKQIEYTGELPTKEWAREFNIAVNAVIAGRVTPDEAKRELGLPILP